MDDNDNDDEGKFNQCGLRFYIFEKDFPKEYCKIYNLDVSLRGFIVLLQNAIPF